MTEHEHERSNFAAGLISLAIIVGVIVIIGGLTWWGLEILTSQVSPVENNSAVVNEDPVVNEDGADSPGESVPRCTDAIADAGGICYGEPLPPCPTEDSDNCYWDADTMGNGEGRDSIVINLGEDGAIAVSPDELPTPTITDGVNR